MRIASLLKKIFPRAFLKQAFVLVNTIRIATIDRWVWPEESIGDSAFLMRSEKNPFLSMAIDTKKLPDNVRLRLSRWEDPAWTQDEYVLVFGRPGVIDPQTGWAITGGRRLIYPSLGFSRAPHVKRPGLSIFFSRRREAVALARIISLRDTGEENYFHFYNDVVAKLYFLEDAGFSLQEYSIVVGEKLAEKSYFKALMHVEKFRSLRWHVQRTEIVTFQEAVFCKPLTHTVKYFKQCVADLAGKLSPAGDLRLFLTRSRSSFRYINNEEAIMPVLHQYHFKVIDTADLSLHEQIVLFRQCRYLIAVHGAGITNIIYRMGAPLSLIEIAPPVPHYIPFHYIMLCEMFQFDYRAIVGTTGKAWGTGGFELDPTDLEKLIRNMIDEGGADSQSDN